MCGIFGAINVTNQWHQGTIRALTLANRDRGTDSLGFYDSTGRMTKRAGDPKDVLAQPSISAWLSKSQNSGQWFIAGHTRFATRGSVCRKNSHPFRYGRIIGSHNGCVDADWKFTVDSQYLFWSLNKHSGNYNKALGDIAGYWGLSWFDGEYFYLCCHHGELHVCEVDGVYYYSSDDDHLATCTGGTPYKLKEGEVWRFDSAGNIVKSTDDNPEVPKLVVTSTYATGSLYGSYSAGGTRLYNSKYNSKYSTSTGSESSTWWKDKSSTSATGSDSRNYDQEWMEAWSSYCGDNASGDNNDDNDNKDEYEEDHKSIHSMTDEELENYAG